MSARPHVLMTTDAVGGVWTYALDLGRGLTQSGLRVSLAVLGPGLHDHQRAQARAAGVQLVELGGALDWTAADEAQVACSAADLRALTLRLRPDLIHLNSPALAAFGPLGTPVLAACHSCVKTWWAAVKGDAPLPSDLAWRAALTARGYAAAHALLAPSPTFAQATQAAYDLPEAPHVILNGRAPILPSWGRATPRSGVEGTQPPLPVGPLGPLRGQLPQEGSILGVEVLTAGRLWDEGKDVATLDRAASRLTGIIVQAAGPLAGPDGDALHADHLIPLGRLDDPALHARLRARPIFVSTSLYEPFGLAVLEAAQAGCPLVLSDIATFRELWDGAAVFFPPGDDGALAACLAGLAADLQRREALGSAARTRADRYTAEAMTHATRQLYAALSPAFARAEAAA